MAGFEAELRNSIRDLQTAAAATAAQVDKANTSLRQMQTEVRGVAGAHREAASAAGQHAAAAGGVAHEIHGIGHAAKFAGGEGGALVGHLGRLAMINPVAIAAGLGIGFITNKIIELLETDAKLDELFKKLEDLPGRTKKALAAAGKEAVDKLDVQGERKKAFDEAMGVDDFSGVPEDQRAAARDAANIAVSSGQVKSRSEAVANLTKAGAFNRRRSGLGDVRQRSPAELAAIAAGFDGDPDDFVAGVGRAAGSRRGVNATEAESAQRVNTSIEDQRSTERLNIGLGGSGEISHKLDQLREAMDRLGQKITADSIGNLPGQKSAGQAEHEAQLRQMQADYDATLAQLAGSTK